MKAVLMSIHPKWCEKIFNGEKTIEVRKTAPKLEAPFTVYVYQTKLKVNKGDSFMVVDALNENLGCGKVIGSFVCYRITCCQAYCGESGEKHLTNLFGDEIKRTCLTGHEMFDYIVGKGKKEGTGWLWHITEPKLFDKARELREFIKPCPFNEDCDILCPYSEGEYHGDGINGDVEFIGCGNTLTRPPQSWCYVEEKE